MPRRPRQMQRSCPHCDVLKPLTDYPWQSASYRGWCTACRAERDRIKALKTRSKGWREVHPEMLKMPASARPAGWNDPETARARYLMRHYLLTPERYDLMSKNGCMICGAVPGNERRLHVDHDHRCCAGPRSCGRCVRGVLCDRCNTGLGNFRDDPELMQKAIDYLKS